MLFRSERPSSSTFEQQLIRLGEEESDAVRLSRSVGRSWSVYRRVCAKNPAISRPDWLNQSFIRTLLTLCLVGSWNCAKLGDRSCVEAIDGRRYEDLDLELRSLHQVDDSPVLQIGKVWRAKSPLELLHLCAPMLSTETLDRFFSIAQAVLTKPDPSLELAEEKRWMAGIYGKVREESGIVIDAITDSLVKLSVYAEGSPGESSSIILGRINALIRELLHEASAERWLSVSGVLRDLAEAAPDEFLTAIEDSLRNFDRPVTRLISESGSSGGFGRCWHSGLLWALELLAWSPERLYRIAGVLADLSAVPVPGNWGNTPARSLQSLFRAWWPQTMATSERRLAALDRLIRDHNDSAWSLMISLLPRQTDWASANAAPVWRDDDAGKADLRNRIDLSYLSEIGARIIAQAEGHPTRIATLTSSLDSFEGNYKDAVIQLIETATQFGDDERVLIRDSLCKYLSWHNSYNRDGDRESRAAAERLRPMFDKLAPCDPVKSCLWLFDSDWITLPDGREEDHEWYRNLLEKERCQAFNLVFASLGWPGISRLAGEVRAPGLVGRQIGRSTFDNAEIVDWLIRRCEAVDLLRVDLAIRGLLIGISEEQRGIILQASIAQMQTRGLSSAIPDLLRCAPFAFATWELLESLDGPTQDKYWETVTPGICELAPTHLVAAVEQLLMRGRARSAFQAVMFEFGHIDSLLLKRILEAIGSGAEQDGPRPDGWHIGEAIGAIEAAGSVPRREVAMLEFAYFEVLEHTKHGAKNLYSELLRDAALFVECICLAYKPRHRETEPIDDSKSAAAAVAWRVLHDGRGIPGLGVDGVIDDSEFRQWVSDVRRQATESDRTEVADFVIGAWLSKCQPEGDGRWPPAVIAELLDADQHADMRRGFSDGLINNRGITSRAMDEGGAQERALAAQYRARSAAVALRYPKLAEVLISLAVHYEHDARLEDEEANLRIEGL